MVSPEVESSGFRYGLRPGRSIRRKPETIPRGNGQTATEEIIFLTGDSMRFTASWRHQFVLFVPAIVVTAFSAAFGDETAPAGQKPEKAPDIGAPTKEDLANPRMVFIKSVLSRYTV